MSAAGEAACARAREAIHATLDADLVEAGVRETLAAHVAECPACRELEVELRALQRGLRGLPDQRLPDAALEQVFRRTVRAASRPRWAGARIVAAAAAVALFVLGGFWLRHTRAPSGPTEAELQRAAKEAHLVLRVASDALRRTEVKVFEDVLAEEVSGALRRVPIRWPERDDARRRGT